MTIACGQQQPGARTAAETRLPLYLKGRERTSVDAEGPALVVRKVGRAAVRYPLARLARIIAGAKIQWSGRALRLCMDAEIPIVLVGDGDTPVGYVQPAVLHRSRLDGLLLQWVDCPQWPDRLQNWQRAQRMFLVKAWHSAHEQIDAGAADGDFKELVRRYVQETDPARADSGKIYRAALAAFATQKIQEAGLAARYWGHGVKRSICDSSLHNLWSSHSRSNSRRSVAQATSIPRLVCVSCMHSDKHSRTMRAACSEVCIKWCDRTSKNGADRCRALVGRL